MPSAKPIRRASGHSEQPSITLYVADDLRQEISGKVSMIGLYADRVVVLQIPPGSPEPSEETPLVIDGLSFLVNIAGLSGRHRLSVRFFVDGSSPLSEPQMREADFDPQLSANFAVRIRPFAVATFGRKKVVVTVDDNEPMECVFELRKGTLSAEAEAHSRRPRASKRKPPAKRVVRTSR